MDKIHEVYFDLIRNNYTAYCQFVHEGRWLVSKHLKYLCERVQSFISTDTGHAYDILLVQLPPQHGKSMTITETLPSFYNGKHPEEHVILASYNDDTAARFTEENSNKIKLFGKQLFSREIGDMDRSDGYNLKGHHGGLISRGIRGGITSNPANLIIVDDPIKNDQEADSETFRQSVWREWQKSIKTRLAAHGKIIVIMTRWHEDDLAGRIIKNEPHVEIISLPCEAEENDVLGRKVGDALFPEIDKGNEWLADFKKGYRDKEGTRSWLALYQGRPSSEKGNLIKRDWWKFYIEAPEMIQEIMSVDATFKGNDNNDFVSIQVWGKRNADMYLLDKDKRHLDFPQTMAAIRDMKKKHPNVSLILIEDKANGSAIISMLQHEIPGIIPINPDGGKVARVNAVSHVIESGNTYLPQDAEWLNEFIEECSAFPNGVHDDDVDAMSQALNRFIYFGADIPEIEQPDIYAAFGSEEKSEGLFSGTVTEEYLIGGW